MTDVKQAIGINEQALCINEQALLVGSQISSRRISISWNKKLSYLCLVPILKYASMSDPRIVYYKDKKACWFGFSLASMTWCFYVVGWQTP